MTNELLGVPKCNLKDMAREGLAAAGFVCCDGNFLKIGGRRCEYMDKIVSIFFVPSLFSVSNNPVESRLGKEYHGFIL